MAGRWNAGPPSRRDPLEAGLAVLLILLGSIAALPVIQLSPGPWSSPLGVPPSLSPEGSGRAPVTGVDEPGARDPLATFGALSVYVGPATVFLLNVGAKPTQGQIPLTTTFNVSVRSSSTSASTFWFNWSFGDGSPAQNYSASAAAGVNASMHVAHTYATPGFFNASARVGDNRSSDGTVSTRMIEIKAPVPLVVAPIANPAPATYGRTVTLYPNISGGLAPFTVSWSGLASGCSQKGNDVNCTSPVGNHSGIVTVVDNASDTLARQVNFTVEPKLTGQAAVQSWYVCNGTEGILTENLSAVITGGTPAFVYTWNFGDGTPNGSGPRVSHVYEVGATYQATLVVVDASGANVTAHASIATSFPSCGAVPKPSFLPPVTVLQGGVIVLAIAIVVLLVLFLRGARRRPTPAAPPAGATEPPAGGRVSPPK